jgi:hypothetical protein
LQSTTSLPCESSIPCLLRAPPADRLKLANAQQSRYLDDVPTVNRRHASLGLANRPLSFAGTGSVGGCMNVTPEYTPDLVARSARHFVSAV